MHAGTAPSRAAGEREQRELRGEHPLRRAGGPAGGGSRSAARVGGGWAARPRACAPVLPLAPRARRGGASPRGGVPGEIRDRNGRRDERGVACRGVAASAIVGDVPRVLQGTQGGGILDIIQSIGPCHGHTVLFRCCVWNWLVVNDIVLSPIPPCADFREVWKHRAPDCG